MGEKTVKLMESDVFPFLVAASGFRFRLPFPVAVLQVFAPRFRVVAVEKRVKPS